MNRRREIEGTWKSINRGFVLPMIGINYKQLPRNFVNSYITLNYDVVMCFDKTDNYDVIFLAFLENVVKNNRSYISYEDGEDEVVIYFTVPERWRDDFDTFISGKYSTFTDKYKDVIVRFFGKKSQPEHHEVSEYDIITAPVFKRKEFAEWLDVDVSLIKEVFQRPNMDREMYSPIEDLINRENKIEQQDK